MESIEIVIIGILVLLAVVLMILVVKNPTSTQEQPKTTKLEPLRVREPQVEKPKEEPQIEEEPEEEPQIEEPEEEEEEVEEEVEEQEEDGDEDEQEEEKQPVVKEVPKPMPIIAIKEVAAADGFDTIVLGPLEDEKPLKVRPFRKTFEQNLIGMSDVIKLFYDELKNKLLSHRKVTGRMSRRNETFRFKREILTRLVISGKALKVYFALDPNKYDVEEYKHKDMSEIERYIAIPLVVRVRSERSCKRALVLLDDVIAKFELEEKRRFAETDYVKQLINRPETSIGRIGLANLVLSEATDDDVKLINEKMQRKCTQINCVEELDFYYKESVSLDRICETFHSGEIVNKATLRKRKLISRTTNFVNITSEGTLSKPLTFVADSFDSVAVKKILLTGGTVTRIKYGNKEA